MSEIDVSFNVLESLSRLHDKTRFSNRYGFTDRFEPLTVRERILLDLIAMDNEQLYKAMSPEATKLLEDCQCEDCVKAHGTCVSTDENGFQPCQLDTMDYMDMPTTRRHIILPDDEDAAT